MNTIDVIAMPADDDNGGNLWRGGPDRYDYNRLPGDLQDQAKLAQGTVVEGLSSAVRRVMDAGQALAWAKSELPHGEYLPWVQQACGLKPDYAARLVRAAEWTANVGHAPHFDRCTDATTLFLLSADTTTEEVREWFMERCEAGEVPTRKEVQERKRSAGRSRAPQPAEALAVSLIRKGQEELTRIRAAVALAERAEVVTAEQVMVEQRLRQLPKAKLIEGLDADFHKLKDGDWIRLPHAGRVDLDPTPEPSPVAPQTTSWPPQPTSVVDTGLMPLARAAELLGMTVVALTNRLTPRSVAKQGELVRNGYRVAREGRGMVRLTPC
jgi:predicted HTH domain antitoxin